MMTTTMMTTTMMTTTMMTTIKRSNHLLYFK